VTLTFVGSGDAFGSGGRRHTCFHVAGRRVNFLVDCGASSLIGLKAARIPLNEIQAIFITHFHADHFGGVPFFVLDAQLVSKRAQPLAVVGPPGLPAWYERSMETAFPGSSRTTPRFALSLIEMEAAEPRTAAGVEVTAVRTRHGDPGGPSLAYRLEAEDRVLAYTGDGEWTEDLVRAAADADLLVAEAYFFDRKVKLHLDLATLVEQLPRLRPKRLVLAHMSDDMLGRLDALQYETAYDGKVVEF
jgi:ribonuclease BN (tRNA processing enzyme)